MGYQAVLLIFVKVDNISEGSWKCSHDPSGLQIISALTKAREVQFLGFSHSEETYYCHPRIRPPA